MDSKSSAIYQKAVALAKKAIEGLKAGQKEGSPSKITTQSGKYFTQGYINGIGALSKDLIETVQELVEDAVGSLDNRSIIQGMQTSAAAIMGTGSPLSFGSVSGIRSAVAHPQQREHTEGPGRNKQLIWYRITHRQKRFQLWKHSRHGGGR